MDITEQLISYIDKVSYNDLPLDVVVAAKRSILDTLGVVLAGTNRPGARDVAKLVKEWGGKSESTVLLNAIRVPVHEAVFANSTMARATDLDDFHIQTASHPSAIVVPVALAVAELRGRVSGKELITGVVAGSEVICRMRLVPDFCSAVSGWSSEVHGGFGAAVTAGKIMGLTSEEMRHALGLAYSQAAGVAQPFYEGALATRLQEGFAARSGVLAALLASRGITGARNFLEGRAGFYPVYYRGIKCDVGRLIDGIGEKYEVLNVATKLYPCCGYTHAAIENVLDIMQRNRVSAEDVSKVLLRVNQRTYSFVCTPQQNKYRPQTVVDAMFSLPYVVGVAMVRGDVFLEDFTPEAIGDTGRLKGVDRVEVMLDEKVERESKELNLPLSLHIADLTTESGKCFSQKMLHVKGYPQKPLTMEDCAEKVKKCALFAVKPFPEDKVTILVDIVRNLERCNDVSSLGRLLS